MSPQKHHTPGPTLWELSEKDREHAEENAIRECQGCYHAFPRAILTYCEDCGDLFCEHCINSDDEHGCQDREEGAGECRECDRCDFDVWSETAKELVADFIRRQEKVKRERKGAGK